jgi:hypothetical protein
MMMRCSTLVDGTLVRFTIKEVLSHHQAKALGPGTALRMEGGGLLEEDEVLPQG